MSDAPRVPSMTAREALAAGRACIIATDTVYGLAALPGSPGYDEVFRLKRRPHDQTLPWLVADVDALSTWAERVPDYVHDLAGRWWPGALTLVARASGDARALGGIAADGTVALRCPDEPACLRLLRDLPAPLACTSANLHGEPAAARRAELAPAFAGLPGYSELPPACRGAVPSTILDCTGAAPRVLREGPISF